MYFNNCTTIDQAKNLFRDLCKKLHPDTSGYSSNADFIKMYQEFEAFKPKQTAENEPVFNAAKFYDLLKQFDCLTKIKVSFVGTFIWLEDLEEGATYFQRHTIKQIAIIGYNAARFASQKKCWYFSPEDYQQKSRSKKNLEEIKNSYGCSSFEVKNRMQIA
jgi:hypothetical protein